MSDDNSNPENNEKEQLSSVQDANAEVHDDINDSNDIIKTGSKKKRKSAAKANKVFEVFDEIMDTNEGIPAKEAVEDKTVTDKISETNTTSLEDALAGSSASSSKGETISKALSDNFDSSKFVMKSMRFTNYYLPCRL